MKKIFFMALALTAMVSCGDNKSTTTDEATEPTTEEKEAVTTDADDAEDDGDAVLKLDDADVELDDAVEVEEEAPAKSNTNIDAFLDEYENYCTKLAGLSKKAMSGDLSALTDYTSLLESAEKLQSKIDDVADDMTPAQAARFQKIIQKIAQAAM